MQICYILKSNDADHMRASLDSGRVVIVLQSVTRFTVS